MSHWSWMKMSWGFFKYSSFNISETSNLIWTVLKNVMLLVYENLYIRDFLQIPNNLSEIQIFYPDILGTSSIHHSVLTSAALMRIHIHRATVPKRFEGPIWSTFPDNGIFQIAPEKTMPEKHLKPALPSSLEILCFFEKTNERRDLKSFLKNY